MLQAYFESLKAGCRDFPGRGSRWDWENEPAQMHCRFPYFALDGQWRSVAFEDMYQMEEYFFVNHKNSTADSTPVEPEGEWGCTAPDSDYQAYASGLKLLTTEFLWTKAPEHLQLSFSSEAAECYIWMNGCFLGYCDSTSPLKQVYIGNAIREIGNRLTVLMINGTDIGEMMIREPRILCCQERSSGRNNRQLRQNNNGQIIA